MKKIVLFSIIALIGFTASAADQTKAQFLAAWKAQMTKAGKPFNPARFAKMFNDKDTNKDGILSDEERNAKPAEKPAETPAEAPAETPAESSSGTPAEKTCG